MKTVLKSLRFLLSLGTICWIYSPIIAGILIPMVYMLPIAFTSWWLFASVGSSRWANGWIMMEVNPDTVVFIVFEFLIFSVGLVLFVWGVITIAKSRIRKEGLITHGLYRFIRHPQHLGLSIMTLVTSLYIPWTTDLGIRLGEILSWSLFTLILIIISDFEDRKLVKKFGEDFLEYRDKTGSFFPRLVHKKKESRLSGRTKLLIKYSILIPFYVGFVLFMYMLTQPPFDIFSYTL